MLNATTPDNPKRPLSEKQLAARRSNARKSTGPRTPEGKARSSQNARKHGFFTQTALLFYEAPEDFVALRDSYIDEYQPQSPTEMHCVMEMANAQFRLRRVRGMEADLIQILITRELPSRSLSNGEMQAQAFRTLADTSNALQLLQRYEVMFRRQYERALRLLWEHRDRLREPAAPATTPRRRRRSTSPDSLSPDDLPPSLLDFPPPCPADFPSAPAMDFSSLLPSSCLPPAPPPAPQHPPKPQNTKLRNEPKPAASCSKKAASSSPPSRASRPRPSRPPESTIPPQTPPQPAALPAPAETRILRNEPKPAPLRHRSRPAQPLSRGSGRVLCRERSRPQARESERSPRFSPRPPRRQHPVPCPLPPRNALRNPKS